MVPAMDDRWLPWREAWHEALYGSDGFYRHASPDRHFRTSVHASPLFSRAIVQLTRRLGLRTVVDLGAGSGELVTQIQQIAPDLDVVAVDVRPRPRDLPDAVDWRSRLPDRFEGLLVANELLDNVPCDVVERDAEGTIRLVEVVPATGAERLGAPASAEVTAWTQAWWPLSNEGERAEVGLERDRFWQASCSAVTTGASLAIDYGHLVDYRPSTSTLTSYKNGREAPLALDGQHDVSAHVAVDAVAAAVKGTLSRQRDMLHDLGLTGARPEPAMADTDPVAYVRALSMSSQAAELMSSPGLGDFHWVLAHH
jgi:SAM-dependent MidA family methyltransferase